MSLYFNWRKFFLGKLEYIRNIKKNCRIPILCKDFFVDTYQVALAKSFGADCILIILSAVDKKLAKDLYDAANDLSISSIVEVHTKQEAENALFFDKSIIGINNRNLKTLDVSLLMPYARRPTDRLTALPPDRRCFLFFFVRLLI